MKKIINKINQRFNKFTQRFNGINGWENGFGSKQSDKFALEFRISKLTIIEIRIDLNKQSRFIIFNVGFEFK